jgi:hypothetical protein
MSADEEAALRARIQEHYAAWAALERHDSVIPIEAGRILRIERGPGSYEGAVRQQQADRQVQAVLEKAGRPPEPGEHSAIAKIRALLACATPIEPGTP